MTGAWLGLAILISGTTLGVAWAESEVAPTPPTEPVAAPAPAVTPKISRTEKDSGPLIKAPRPRKGNRREQKETEGTEALERFQADTILKSPYTLDGQSLEVDPD